jgi:ubiquitin-like domain-containing CTD phosphatase 1
VPNNSKEPGQHKCGDCVGDAILCLLGIRSTPKPFYPSTPSYKTQKTSKEFASQSTVDSDYPSVKSTSSSSSFCSREAVFSAFTASTPFTTLPSKGDETGMDATNHLSSSPRSAVTDTISSKLQKLASKTEFLFINQPRRNTKLLVLDLDHTLMDFSCRFDYMAEQLKRPYLDTFLAQAYLYYDIAVWSQTNFKWLELKLTELGMLNRSDYKICFALVRNIYISYS